MLSDENRDVVLRHVAAETEHRMDETLATLTEDCVFDDRAFGRVWHGREGARAYYRLWWDAFGIAPHTGARYAPSPDLLIVETNFKGRHVGPFLGIAPTGRPVDVPMTIFVTFARGLLSGERFYWNLGTLLEQIGVAMPVRLPAAA
ncbi:MAG: nuclear transport factor 2 family protein [Rhodospirillaceae bacterium]|nr:nuclear transport factor 2 family protein [Rhodospirillaceae bacterium]